MANNCAINYAVSPQHGASGFGEAWSDAEVAILYTRQKSYNNCRVEATALPANSFSIISTRLYRLPTLRSHCSALEGCKALDVFMSCTEVYIFRLVFLKMVLT